MVGFTTKFQGVVIFMKGVEIHKENTKVVILQKIE